MSLEKNNCLRTELWAVDVKNIEEEARDAKKEQPVKWQEN